MKIVEFLKKIFSKKDNNQLLNEPKTKYQELVESIDDLELCKMFLEKTKSNTTPDVLKAFKSYQHNVKNIYEYPLKTGISKEDTLELAQKFFESTDYSLSKKYNDIVNGNNPDIILEMEQFNGKGSSVTNPNKKPITVYVPIRDDIRLLYEMIHECTHTFDIENGDTPTRNVLGEVAPQCMERLLDDFLLDMSDEDMKKYGFDRQTIENDVKDRRITTFLSRYNNAQTLNNGNGNRKLDSRYMLAQIYSAHFNKFDKKQKKNKLVSFIENVKNDEFDMANSCFELSIDKNAKLNGLHRETYVGDSISEVVDLIVPKTQSDSLSQQKDIDSKERG